MQPIVLPRDDNRGERWWVVDYNLRHVARFSQRFPIGGGGTASLSRAYDLGLATDEDEMLLLERVVLTTVLDVSNPVMVISGAGYATLRCAANESGVSSTDDDETTISRVPLMTETLKFTPHAEFAFSPAAKVPPSYTLGLHFRQPWNGGSGGDEITVTGQVVVQAVRLRKVQ